MVERQDECRDALNNALILNPAYDEAWVFRGRLMREMDRQDEAAYCFSEALRTFDLRLEADPSDTHALRGKADLLLELGRPDEVVALFKAAIGHDESVTDSWSEFARAYLALGQPKAAARVCTLALTKGHRSWELHHLKGAALLARGRPKEALRPLEAALALEARPEIALDVARALLALGRWQEAVAAASIDGADVAEAAVIRGRAYEAGGRLDDALAAYDAALEVRTGDVALWLAKGDALARAGRPREALRCFDAAIALDDSLAEAWAAKGRALDALGHAARAEKCHRVARGLEGDLETGPR